MHFLVTGVHPQLVDTKIGKPLLKEAMEHFPEWSEKDVSRLLNFQILVLFQYGVFSVCKGRNHFKVFNHCNVPVTRTVRPHLSEQYSKVSFSLFR